MIKFIDVSKSYKDGQNKKLVIDNLNLDICNTGLYTFLGPSGSGKTTILNLISLLDNPDSGDILINEKSILKFTQKEIDEYRSNYIDYIFQDFNLFENESVIFNLSIITEDKEKIKEVLHTVSLDNFESRKVSSLSIGEKQRVAIARSIIKNSKILLCDEPTGNLDVENTKVVFELLKKLSKTKLVILVTHDVDNAKKYSDVTYKLKEGKVEEEIINKIEEIKDSNTSTNSKVRLGLGKIIKLGLSNIKKSLGVFIITAIIVISQFAACISMIAVNSYDKSNAITKTMKENQIYNAEIFLHKDDKSKSGGRLDEYSGPEFIPGSEEEGDTKIIQSECKDNTVATEYFFNVYFDFFTDNKNLQFNEDYSLYSLSFAKIVVADTFDKFYQPLLSGRYPKGEGEIVLYDYIIDSLYHYEVIDSTDMVNKILTYHFMDREYKMTVVGILKTPYKKFIEKYNEYVNNEGDFSYRADEYANGYLYSLKNIFCLRETYNKLKDCYDSDYVQMKSRIEGLTYNDGEDNFYASPFSNYYKIISDIESLKAKLIYVNENQKDENEEFYHEGVFISKKALYKSLNVNSDEEFNNLRFAGKLKSDSDNSTSGFEGLFSNFYLVNYEMFNSRYPISKYETRRMINNFRSIAGIIDSEEECSYIFNDYYKRGYDIFDYCHSNIFLSNSWSKNKKLIKQFGYLEKKSDRFYDSAPSNWKDEKFCISNMITEAVEENDGYLKEVRNMTNLISILLFAASFGLLFYFSFSSIKENLYKIGLLSSLGCSKIKALSIYLVSFVFLFLVSFICAIPIGFFVVSKINGIYLKNLTSILYFFSISPTSIFISLIISLGVLLLGIAYPLIKLYKTPVIKTIKVNKNN